MTKITVDEINGRKYLVMKTDHEFCEYDPGMPATSEAWNELEIHMMEKTWWTPQHKRELSMIRAEHMSKAEQ